MRKILVLEFLTLDGVLQAPGGPEEDTSEKFKYGGWQFPYFDNISGELMQKQMRQPFALLLGRKTYDIFAGYWPKHEDMWPGVNKAEKYVASNTLTKLEWKNSILLNGDVPANLRKLKQEDGVDLKVYGSGNLVQTLLKHDLVDELWLKIHPLTLGTGKRLFADGTMPAAFTLIESHATPSGVIFANYKRTGEVKSGSFE